MENNTFQSDWLSYVQTERALLTPILSQKAITLHADQPHLKGERFLMQNLTTTGGKKLILIGQYNAQKVVIKATRDQAGSQELTHERNCRKSLHELNFAYQPFHSSKELLFFSKNGFTISVQAFIEQASSFLERDIQEQFFFALNAFKTQESARATTSSHYRSISRIFGIRTSKEYLDFSSSFETSLQHNHAEPAILKTIVEARKTLETERKRIEQYCGFLTHTDFVPHNFRINNGTLYLLDFSSLQFGNKHESWARFLNFMTLYNHELEALLIEYVERNRAPEERASLQLMRLYRLTEIITYYQKTLTRSTHNLKQLNHARTHFWHDVLRAELRNERVSRDVIKNYQETRDALRSQDEKERQQGLH